MIFKVNIQVLLAPYFRDFFSKFLMLPKNVSRYISYHEAHTVQYLYNTVFGVYMCYVNCVIKGQFYQVIMKK